MSKTPAWATRQDPISKTQKSQVVPNCAWHCTTKSPQSWKHLWGATFRTVYIQRWACRSNTCQLVPGDVIRGLMLERLQYHVWPQSRHFTEPQSPSPTEWNYFSNHKVVPVGETYKEYSKRHAANARKCKQFPYCQICGHVWNMSLGKQ